MTDDPTSDETEADQPASASSPVRGQYRVKGYLRVSHGLFRVVDPKVESTSENPPHEDAEFHRDLEAWLLVLPADAVFTHVTGARLRGWSLPKLPEQVPVFAASREDNRPRRPGLLCSRLTHPSEKTTRFGLPVEASEEILLRAARDLGLLDLVIMIDSARHKGDIDVAAMERLLASRRPGVRQLRAAWRLSHHLAESAGETLLRVFHDCIDVPVRPQAPLFDTRGSPIGRADLLVIGTPFLHEYDGGGHRDAKQHRVDLRRDRGLVGTEYVRRGYTLDDLLNHALVVMHEIDRALERPHQLHRLARWRALVAGSMYDESTRTRVMNRWHRQMGVVDWSRTG